jgi:hypothetical protein
MVYTHGLIGGGWGSDFYKFEEDRIMFDFEVTINNRQMSNEIWRRGNWEFVHNGEYYSTYTLIINDDFLNNTYLP